MDSTQTSLWSILCLLSATSCWGSGPNLSFHICRNKTSLGDPPALKRVSADKEPGKVLWKCRVLYKRGLRATVMEPRVVAGRPFVSYTESPPAWMVNVCHLLRYSPLLALCWAQIHGPSSSRQRPWAAGFWAAGSCCAPLPSPPLEAPGSLRKHGVQVNKWPFVRKVN